MIVSFHTGSKIRTPLLTGRLPLDFDEEAIYGRSAVILLGLSAPCEALLAENDAGPDELRSTLKQRLSPRLQFISNNFNLMKKSKEDAIKDFKMWDTHADCDEVINANDAEDVAEEEEAADDETDEVKDSKNISAFFMAVLKSVPKAPLFEPTVALFLYQSQFRNLRKLSDFPVGDELHHYRHVINDLGIVMGDSLTGQDPVNYTILNNIKEWKTELGLLERKVLSRIAGELDKEFSDFRQSTSRNALEAPKFI
ncbi:hypothetical protein F4804DRAFT_334152 [Jackrogersella minutella]|nr:hypothetical protein F4804DRAFT_334152 [Jackrogersella minutella]